MPKYITENALSADNQQATPISSGSPQRLYAEYPKKRRLTSQEAILLGVLYTDGCLSKKSKNCWRFYLSNTSFEIIETFRRSMIKVFNLDNQKIKISQKIVNGKPFYKAIVDSGCCGSVLTSKYGTFRTLAYKGEGGRKIYPPTKLPFTKNDNLGIISKFLQIAFSCDGGVNLYVAKSKSGYRFLIRNLYIACHHPQLQLDYRNLLSLLKVRSKILLKDNKVLVQGKQNLQNFRDKIGFLDKVKITQHSAFWQGREKNEVLNLILSSYGNPRDIINLPQFLG